MPLYPTWICGREYFKDSHCVLCDGIIYCQISISFFGTTSYSASKIPILLEEANVCRNIAMAIFLFFIFLLYDKYVSIYISMIVAECLFYVIAFFICIFSYKKKIRQISDRIDKSRSA